MSHRICSLQKSNLLRVMSESILLSEEERAILHNLISKRKFFLDGTIITWKNKPVGIELKQDAKPHHAKLNPAPKVNGIVFKKGAERIYNRAQLKIKSIIVGNPHIFPTKKGLND